MTHHNKSTTVPTQRQRKLTMFFSVILILGFTLGLGLAILINALLGASQPQSLDITFINPREAVIFWQTRRPGIGYIQYGERKNQRNIKIQQTSSEPSTIHTVMLENLPLNPVYASFHSDTEPWFQIPHIEEISYETQE